MASSKVRTNLVAALKVYKEAGQTNVKLNGKTELLQDTHERLMKWQATFLVGQASELTCEWTAPPQEEVLVKDYDAKTALKKAKKVHPAQVESEAKRVASQAPRHKTKVNDKYKGKKEKATVTPINKVECKFKKADEYNEYFVSTSHKRFEGKREISWSPSIIEDTAVAATKAALGIVKGFIKQSVRAA